MGEAPDLVVSSGAGLACTAAGAGKFGIGKSGGIVFKHRSVPNHEVYFLSNTSEKPADFTASLSVTGRMPWICPVFRLKPPCPPARFTADSEAAEM